MNMVMTNCMEGGNAFCPLETDSKWTYSNMLNYTSSLVFTATNETGRLNTTSEEDANSTVADLPISITIPREVFNQSQALVFTSYISPVLFQVVPPVELNRSSYDVTADTAVLGFSIPDKTFVNLSNPVLITLQSFRTRKNEVSDIITLMLRLIEFLILCRHCHFQSVYHGISAL